MSDLDIRRALATQLLTAIPSDDIAWENTDYDPSGKSGYYAFYFYPSTETANGKLLTDSVDQDGFLQISIFSRLSGNDYGTAFYQMTDIIKAAFPSGLSLTYNDQVVDIIDSTNINPSESESWYQGGLTINYQAFKARN